MKSRISVREKTIKHTTGNKHINHIYSLFLIVLTIVIIINTAPITILDN